MCLRQGGAINAQYSSVVISDTDFVGNSAKLGGGAVAAGSCVNGSLNVYNCQFSGNSARRGSGGAAFISSCNATFNATGVDNNTGGAAGAFYAELSVQDSDKVGEFSLYLDQAVMQNNRWGQL